MDRYSDVKNNYFAVWERHTEYREIDEEKRNGTRYIWMHGKAFGGNETATEWTHIEHWTEQLRCSIEQQNQRARWCENPKK